MLEYIIVCYIHLDIVRAQDFLLSDLSQVSRDHSLECEFDISYDEISRTETQLNNIKDLEYLKNLIKHYGTKFKEITLYQCIL